MEQALGLNTSTVMICGKPHVMAPITIGNILAIKREQKRLIGLGEDETITSIEVVVFIAAQRLKHSGLTAQDIYEASPAELEAISEMCDADLKAVSGNPPATT